MNVLSLFDGISCGRLALERAGIKVDNYYASEIDKHAIKITQYNYPDTIQLGDVTKIDFNQFKGKIDLLIGGSPCQDLSISKANRQGLRGERSGLFFTYVKARDIIQPKYFLLENNYSMPKEVLWGCNIDQPTGGFEGNNPKKDYLTIMYDNTDGFRRFAIYENGALHTVADEQPEWYLKWKEETCC